MQSVINHFKLKRRLIKNKKNDICYHKLRESQNGYINIKVNLRTKNITNIKKVINNVKKVNSARQHNDL